MRKLPLALVIGFVVASSSTVLAEDQPVKKTLSPAQQTEASEGIINRGMGLSRRVRGLLNDARKVNDIIKTTCLNKRLAEINANLRNAQRRLNALKKAVDEERRNHEFTVIGVLGQKFDTLDQEANQCVGQDLFETGKTDVTTKIDDSLVPMGETPSSPPVVLPPTLPTLPPPSSGME